MSHPIAALSQLQARTRHETMYSNSSHSTWARAKTYHAAQGRIFQQGMRLQTSANMQSDCSLEPHFLGMGGGETDSILSLPPPNIPSVRLLSSHPWLVEVAEFTGWTILARIASKTVGVAP